MLLLGCIQAVHERSDLYPSPGDFDPDRFLSHPFGPGEFLPFGGGARRCIGAALAMFEMRPVLTTVLRDQSFRLAPESDRPIQPRHRGFTLGPSRPVHLVLQ